MRYRLLISLVLLLLLPVTLISYLGYRFAAEEQDMLAFRYQQWLMEKLNDTDEMIHEVVRQRERMLSEFIAKGFPAGTDTIRQWIRHRPYIKNILVLNKDKNIIFPPPSGPNSGQERAFLQKTGRIVDYLSLPKENRLAQAAPPTDSELKTSRAESKQSKAPPSKTKSKAVFKKDQAVVASSSIRRSNAESQADWAAQNQLENSSHLTEGWLTWFWEQGLNLLYFQQTGDQWLVGVELDRMKLLADIIDRLPDGAAPKADYRVALLDANDEVIYQWGDVTEPDPLQTPEVQRRLSSPLTAWQLHYYTRQPVPFNSVKYTLAAGIFTVIFVMTALAIYFYRESSRDIREAKQRMNFVNQVSHELKTPLTNIRMYAELLEQDLEDASPPQQKRLHIIVDESRRLSRLIGNVLTFAKQKNSRLQLHPKKYVVDDCINNVIALHQNSFDKKGIQVVFNGAVNESVNLDCDALEQILHNLFSNVEKYAKGASRLLITSELMQEMTRIVIEDDGPGITPRAGKRIFQEFYRADASLTSHVTGTGIGLSIARDLARKHGGDLIWLPSDGGAKFQLTLLTPKV